MNVTRSLEKLIFRFTKSIKNDDGTKRQNIKPFYPNQSDIDALKNIISWISEQKLQSISNNRIFAKLFIDQMQHEIWRTSSYDLAVELMQRKLEISLDDYYKSFQTEMMMFNFDQAWIVLEGTESLNYEKGVSVSKRKENAKERLQFIKNNELELKKTIISDHWNKKNTNNRLNDMLGDILNQYGNRQ